jgi:hypothetical protein
VITKPALQDKVRRHAPAGTVVIMGCDNGMIDRHYGGEFLYVDHSYFMRGWHNKMCRIVRNATHLTRVIKHETDRLRRFNVEIKPYRTNGSHVVVLAPGKWLAKVHKKQGIEHEMAAELRKYTDRRIEVQFKGSPLLDRLKDAWAVVSPFSVGGAEAAVAGYPVFSTPLCPSWPVSAGELKDIESPTLHERYEWANSLAWSSWSADEFGSINFKEYQCAL